MESLAWGAAHPHYGLTLEDLFDENPGADFLFWDRIAYWTVEEATALSFGFDPNLANWGELLSCDHPFTKLYENRRALALRAVEMGQLPKLAAPLDYISWTKKVGIEFNPDLEKKVRARCEVRVAHRAVNQHPGPKVLKSLFKIALGMVMVIDGFNPKAPDRSIYQDIADDLQIVEFQVGAESVERVLTGAADGSNELSDPGDYETLTKMVVGIAIKHYNYDPLVKRSQATQKITNDLLLKNITVDADTVRLRLKEAAALLRSTTDL
jgi:hypothetical protein